MWPGLLMGLLYRHYLVAVNVPDEAAYGAVAEVAQQSHIAAYLGTVFCGVFLAELVVDDIYSAFRCPYSSVGATCFAGGEHDFSLAYYTARTVKPSHIAHRITSVPQM